MFALGLKKLSPRLDQVSVFLARLKLDQGRAGGDTLAVSEHDASDQFGRARGDVDRALAARHAQDPDLICELTRCRDGFSHGLTAPAAGAATTGAACAALVVRQGDLQHRRQDHQPHQTRRHENEKMAFEHATQSPRQQAVPLSGSWPLRK